LSAQDYPVTTPYGYVEGYPLNGGFHQGIDYGCPAGTPIIVNGIVIGLSGATGYVQGAHLHVGRWVNGAVTNPGIGGGFHFSSAIVTEVHLADDSNNGKYVRIQGDGASWVYLHLSRINVNVGQHLQGEDMSEIEALRSQLNTVTTIADGRYANFEAVVKALGANAPGKTEEERRDAAIAVANDLLARVAAAEGDAKPLPAGKYVVR
jgi:hypothetical protein